MGYFVYLSKQRKLNFEGSSAFCRKIQNQNLSLILSAQGSFKGSDQ
jgi:hypothetical protein